MMKILIAYDGSAHANAVLDDLRDAGLPHKALVVVLTVAEPEYFLAGKKPEGVVGWLSHRLTEARVSARRACDEIQARFPEWQVTFDVALASPCWEIGERIERFKPDLVVLGHRGSSSNNCSGLGHVTKCLLKEAACSIRIARGHVRPLDAPSRIVISMDGSRGSEAAVQTVASRSWPPKSEVLLVASIGPVFGELQLAGNACEAQWAAAHELQQRAQQKLQPAGLIISSEVRIGFPATDVIEAASQWNADCIFLGGEAMGFLERILHGDPIANITARAGCSVEVVRSPDRRVATILEFPAKSQYRDSLRIAS